jgi:hypothetical protein
LYKAFEDVDLETGLYLLNKPETDITIVRQQESDLTIRSGETVELFCLADSFPKPKYAIYKDWRRLCNENKYIISNAR